MSFPSDNYTTYRFDNLRFDVSDLQSALFHPLDIEQFESDHPELFSKAPSTRPPERIADLEAQLAQARQENERLTQEIERLKAEDQATAPPRTSKASEFAQAARVEEWKVYAVTMAKAAYQCGLEDKKDVTRTEYERLAKKLGELSPTALELLREALPEVTKTTPGVSRQG